MSLLDGSLDDMGNADRLVRFAGERCLFVAGIGWHRWTGSRWHRDGGVEVAETSKAMVAEATALAADFYAADLANPNPQDPARKFAERVMAHWKRSGFYGPRKAMRDDASTDRRISVANTAIDAHPHLIALGKTTYDATTATERAPDRRDFLTVGTDAEPENESLLGSRWSDFLTEIQPDADVRAYLQRAVGCSLLGEQRDHVIFFAHGDGSNGKGTFFRAIAAAIGDYYTAIPSTMLMESRTQPHAAQIADLMGKRMCVSAEVQRGAKWDEVKVKELTGGDMIKAQFMRENWFSFKPSHTLWICGNDKPRIAGTDRGIWRRMRLIPFTATIDTPDVELDAKLRAERGIVLRWCLDGVATYMRDGLGTCERVERATKEYRSDQDRLGQALADLCDFGPDLVVIKKHFRGALQRHYDDSGFGQAPGDTTLKSDLARRGIESVRPDRGGAWCWRGIALKPEFAQTEPAKRGWGGSHD